MESPLYGDYGAYFLASVILSKIFLQHYEFKSLLEKQYDNELFYKRVLSFFNFSPECVCIIRHNDGHGNLSLHFMVSDYAWKNSQETN